jgi:hypothetical protein
MTYQRFPIEEGHALAFARAIGERAPGPGEVVPPTFTACSGQHDPEHMRDLRPTGALAAAVAAGGTVLHAEQHFEYLGPVCVGDVLTVVERPGRTWEKRNRAGRLLAFTELVKEFTNPVGDVVVRARMVLVRTDAETPDTGGTDA